MPNVLRKSRRRASRAEGEAEAEKEPERKSRKDHLLTRAKAPRKKVP